MRRRRRYRVLLGLLSGTVSEVLQPSEISHQQLCGRTQRVVKARRLTDEQQPHLPRIPHSPAIPQTRNDGDIRPFQSSLGLPDLKCEGDMVRDESESSEGCEESGLRFFRRGNELGPFWGAGGFR